MLLFLMIERTVIPVKAGIQIFVILSEAKDLALGDDYYVAAKRRKKIACSLLFEDN